MKKRILSSIIIFITGFFLLQGCQSNTDRKIKLSDISSSTENISQTASSVLQVSPEQQRYIAILNFENKTDNASLNWLRRGLADMFVTELSQSPYLNIIPTKRIYEVAQKHGKKEKELEDPSVAAMIARQTNAEIVLTGRIYPLGDSLCIDVDMINTKTGRLLRREMVHGYGLEQIFSMVGDLSERVRSNIRGDLKEIRYTGIELKDMTESIEAFRCYSQARENWEKFLREEAEEGLVDAVESDTTFAAAYLELAYLRFDFGKEKEGSFALHKAQKYSNKLSDTDKIRLKLLESRIKGEFLDLIPILEEAVERFPTDVELRLHLARYYREMGNYDGALQEFETAAELDPNRKMLYNDLGYLHAHRGDFTSAINNIDMYRDLAPDEPNPHDSKGEILLMAGRFDEAAEQFKLALTKWPKFYYSAYHLAHLYVELGDQTNALKYVNHAIASAPSKKLVDNFKLLKTMILWKFGQIEEAQAILTELIREHPYSNKPVIILAEIYKSTGDMAAAEGVYESALRRYEKYFDGKKGNFEDVDNFVGLVLKVDLPAQKVIPILEKLSSSKEIPQFFKFVARQTLALMYLRTGDLDKARSCAEKIASQEFDFLISMRHNNGWSIWKPFFESLQYTRATGAHENPFPKRILSIARDTERKDLEAVAHFAKASIFQTHNNYDAVADEYQDVGAPLEENWMVIGPFAANRVSGFEYQYPPEKEVNLKSSYKAANGEITWRSADDRYFDGYVNFESIFDYKYWTVGYGLVYAFSPEERQVQIRVGTDEACKLWLNGELIVQRYYHQDAVVDRDIVTVVLRPGYNKLLIKVTNSDLDWGFYFRITDESGNGFYDITYHSPEELEKKFATR